MPFGDRRRPPEMGVKGAVTRAMSLAGPMAGPLPSTQTGPMRPVGNFGRQRVYIQGDSACAGLV